MLEQVEKLRSNKISGSDCIHQRVLKELEHEEAGLVTKIGNLLLILAIMPTNWRVANVPFLKMVHRNQDSCFGTLPGETIKCYTETVIAQVIPYPWNS